MIPPSNAPLAPHSLPAIRQSCCRFQRYLLQLPFSCQKKTKKLQEGVCHQINYVLAFSNFSPPCLTTYSVVRRWEHGFTGRVAHPLGGFQSTKTLQRASPRDADQTNKPLHCSGLSKLAGLTRLELAASCVTGRRSNQLNYNPGSINVAFATNQVMAVIERCQVFQTYGRYWIRTSDPLRVRQVL
jgi:hypothetical protein